MYRFSFYLVKHKQVIKKNFKKIILSVREVAERIIPLKISKTKDTFGQRVRRLRSPIINIRLFMTTKNHKKN